MVEGRDAMTEARRDFFRRFPDYRKIREHFITRGDQVIVIGRSECAC